MRSIRADAVAGSQSSEWHGIELFLFAEREKEAATAGPAKEFDSERARKKFGLTGYHVCDDDDAEQWAGE